MRYGPSVLRYLVQRHVVNQQEYAGVTQRATLGFNIFVTATIRGPADTLGYPTTLVIDSITADSGVVLPVTVNLDLARGLSYAGALSPRGEFQGGTPSSVEAARTLAPILGGFRDFYPRLPDRGIALGAAWTDTVTHSDQLGVIDQVQVTSIDEAHAAAWEDANGIPALRVEIRSLVSLSGTGQQGGMPVELNGAGTRGSIEYITADGRYLGGTSRDSTTLTIKFHAQGQVVPVTSIALSTIRVLP